MLPQCYLFNASQCNVIPCSTQLDSSCQLEVAWVGWDGNDLYSPHPYPSINDVDLINYLLGPRVSEKAKFCPSNTIVFFPADF